MTEKHYITEQEKIYHEQLLEAIELLKRCYNDLEIHQELEAMEIVEKFLNKIE